MITYTYHFCAAIKVHLDGKHVGFIKGTGIPGEYFYQTKGGVQGARFNSINDVKESLA